MYNSDLQIFVFLTNENTTKREQILHSPQWGGEKLQLYLGSTHLSHQHYSRMQAVKEGRINRDDVNAQTGKLASCIYAFLLIKMRYWEM